MRSARTAFVQPELDMSKRRNVIADVRNLPKGERALVLREPPTPRGQKAMDVKRI